MRLRRLFSLLLSLPLSCVIAFSLVCIDVSALSGGYYMTPADTRQIFGDEFSGKFFNGNDYTNVTFRYSATTKIQSSDWVDSSGYFVQGRDCIVYTAYASGVNSNASYVTVDVQPQYSLFNFDVLYTAIGVSNALPQNISAYQSPFWIWFIDDAQVTFEGGSIVDSQGVFPKTKLQNDTNRQYSICPVQYENQSLTSGYSLRAGFYGAGTYFSTLYIYICCPYITNDASGQTGTFTTTSAVNTDININVDLDETNGLLESINNTISGIVSGIAGIFIPSAADLEEWRLDIVDLLNDTFGDIPALHDQLEDAVENIITVNARTTVDFPGVSPPGVGQIIAPQSVPLKPAGFESLYTFIRTAIDIVATIAVFNMLQNRIKAFLVGETVVYSDNGD